MILLYVDWGRNMKSKKTTVFIVILIIIMLCCLGLIGYYLYDQYIKPMSDDKEVGDAREIYQVVTEPPTDTSQEQPSVSFELNDEGLLVREPEDSESSDVDGAKTDEEHEWGAISNATVAWIYAEGTTIDYPVVQGEDNFYYLTHDYKGNYTQNGAIYMDFKCTTESQNIVIYGHHMRANIQFTGLMKFKEKKWVDEHPTIYLDLADGGSKTWDVIAAFACSHSDTAKFVQTQFSMDAINTFIANIEKYKYYDTGVEYDESSQFCTLVTCSYEQQNARTIVIARRR